jgi:parallel beta-helix repeat protein
MNILPLKEIAPDKRLATTLIPATYPLRPLMFQNAFSYGSESCWMENISEAMENTGDWISDSDAGKIYLVTDGSVPAHPVYAPVLQEFIRLEGSEKSPVRNVSFKNLVFRYADRDSWSKDDVGLQHDWEFYDKSNAVIRLKGAENCTVDGCRIRNCGNSAIRLDFYAQKNRLINNEIFHMGGTGVLLAGYGPGYPDVNRNNEVINNHIHHCGEQYWMCQAIHIWQSAGNRIAHNLIHDMPYIGIVLSGMRPPFFLFEEDHRELYCTVNRERIRETVSKVFELVEVQDGVKKVHPVSMADQIPQYRAMDIMDEFIYTDNNVIEYNEIHDVMQVMADGDAIYLSATGRGNVLRGNYIHDVVAHGSLGHVIRNDGPQFWTLVEDNILLNTSGGITVKDGVFAKNNYIVNIQFPADASHMARRIFCPFQLNSTDTLNPYELCKNVVYFETTQMDKIYNQHAAGSDFTWKKTAWWPIRVSGIRQQVILPWGKIHPFIPWESKHLTRESPGCSRKE